MTFAEGSFRCLISNHDFCKEQKPRTDFDSALARCGGIDIKANPVIFQAEANHSALLQNKIFGIADGQRRAVFYFAESWRKSLGFHFADKEHLAARSFTSVFDVPDANGPRSEHLVPHRVFKRAMKWVVAQNANVEWRAGRFRRVGWPIHQLSEVEDKCGLDTVFIGPGLRAKRLRTGGKKRQRYDGNSSEGKQGTRAQRLRSNRESDDPTHVNPRQ